MSVSNKTKRVLISTGAARGWAVARGAAGVRGESKARAAACEAASSLMVAPAVAFPVIAILVALSGLFSGLTLGLMGALRCVAAAASTRGMLRLRTRGAFYRQWSDAFLTALLPMLSRDSVRMIDTVPRPKPRKCAKAKALQSERVCPSPAPRTLFARPHLLTPPPPRRCRQAWT